MFESAKLGHKVSKEQFKERVPDLRSNLVETQMDLREAGTPTIVIIFGVEAAGKGEVANRLGEWLDPRGIATHAFWDATGEELERPDYWRFWRTMPGGGEIAILFGGWYQRPLEERLAGRMDELTFDRELRRIREFERMLVEDGILIVKFWYHLSQPEQKSRLAKLSQDERSRWKMLSNKAKFSQQYAEFESYADNLVRNTDIARARWYVIEATDKRYRDLTTGQTLLHQMRQHLTNRAQTAEQLRQESEAGILDEGAHISLLDQLDLSTSLEKSEYTKKLNALRDELNALAWDAYKARRPTIIVFEGVDAAGKGGAIRRITQAVDARLRRTIPIAKPTDEEMAHHYLWRFWRHTPRAGYMVVFDRSWYGRVLVERVEGFTPRHRWARAFLEINDFEEQLVDSGAILVKFWLQISQDEQLQRFKEREATPYKQYKITEEDWRNRHRWDDYKVAVDEMLERTSTQRTPWTLVAAEDKLFARIEVMKTLVKTMRKALKGT